MDGTYIFSTLTGNQKYPTYKKVPGRDLPVMVGYVLIHGGANLPSKVLVTPRGVMTHITDEQWGRLKDSPGFKQHVDNGFLTVEDMAYDPADVAEAMEAKDTSAPMVPQDFEAEGIKPPTTASTTADERDAAGSTVKSTQRPTQVQVPADETETESKPKTKPTGRRRRGGNTEAETQDEAPAE